MFHRIPNWLFYEYTKYTTIQGCFTRKWGFYLEVLGEGVIIEEIEGG